MWRRRRILALAAILAVAAAAAAIVLAQSGGHTANAADTGIPSGFTTATVESRTLTERTTVDGTLGYGGAAEIYDRIGGTFTWLPAVGAVIGRGGTLFRIDNLPVVLMYGSVPAYRTLKEGVTDGPDVLELNANLLALGFDPYGAITQGDHFSAATAAAVRRWQHAEGLTETGEVQFGRIVFAPGARRVTTVHVTVGQDPPGAESESPQDEAPKDGSGTGTPSGSGKPAGSEGKPPAKGPSKPSKPSGSHDKPPSSSKPPSHGKPSDASSSPGAKEGTESSPSADGKGSSPSGGKGNSPSSEGGSPSGSGGAPELVLSTTADAQIVTLQVKATQQELARVGESVPVALPDGSTVNGHVSEVGTVASESSEGEKGGEKGSPGGSSQGNGENATIPVQVTLEHPVARLDKAPVSVELVKSIRHDVLAAPATALVATGGGQFALQALEGRRRVDIPVTPGMFANGYVQVEGAGIHEGLTVLEPQ